MTLRDLDEVFLPLDTIVFIGKYNKGKVFNYNNKREVLWEGKFINVPSSRYYDCKLAGLDIVDGKMIVILDDAAEDGFLNEKEYQYYGEKVNEMLDSGYTRKQVMGCIYGLRHEQLINSETEEQLYKIVDLCPDVYMKAQKYWRRIRFDNPLKK